MIHRLWHRLRHRHGFVPSVMFDSRGRHDGLCWRCSARSIFR